MIRSRLSSALKVVQSQSQASSSATIAGRRSFASALKSSAPKDTKSVHRSQRLLRSLSISSSQTKTHASPLVVSSNGTRLTSLSERIVFGIGAPLRFHTSARSLADRKYTRFGGQTSGGGLLENLTARFSDPGTRTLVLIVVGLGGEMLSCYLQMYRDHLQMRDDGLGGYYIYHLERVPESGRWRFIDVSKTAEREVRIICS